MSELRQDRTSGRWAIIAPQRGQRPRMRAGGPHVAPPPSFDPRCPFCPGHEAELPGILAETPGDDASGWRVRVVPNRFPALQQHPRAPAETGHVARPGYGFHEVIIESPRHDADLVTMSAEQRLAAIAAYRDRSRALLEQPGVETAVVFRNHGARAGASLAHPHAQIIALGEVPPLLAAMSAWGRDYLRDHGLCPTCEELEIERRDGTRLVEQNDTFVTLVPFAAEHPFETWIVSRRHQASFTALETGELAAFGGMLARSLRRLNGVLDHPSFKFVIDSAPKRDLATPHFHWRLRLVPEVATWGGFELGTGLIINPSSPEQDASALRAALTGL
jgi:UDPglucose--hexose-1-phosphate uridylyltransferase